MTISPSTTSGANGYPAHANTGLESIQFIEFVAEDIRQLQQPLQQLGFQLQAKHHELDIWLYRQGGVWIVANCENSGAAIEHYEQHGLSAIGIGFIHSDPFQVIQRADQMGYQARLSAASWTGLGFNGVRGEGGLISYLLDQTDWADIVNQEFTLVTTDNLSQTAGFSHIDHIAINVPKGQLDHWREFYSELLQFQETSKFTISGKKTSFRCNPVAANNGAVRLVLNEDFEDGSQISEFLAENRGPGIQHIAFYADDIHVAVETLGNNDINFMHTPDIYYDLIEERIPNHGEDLNRLRQNGVLIDNERSNAKKLLMQIFTNNIIGPVFFELIQRKGNQGFGEGNIKTLFESVELEQMQRGALA